MNGKKTPSNDDDNNKKMNDEWTDEDMDIEAFINRVQDSTKVVEITNLENIASWEFWTRVENERRKLDKSIKVSKQWR